MQSGILDSKQTQSLTYAKKKNFFAKIIKNLNLKYYQNKLAQFDSSEEGKESIENNNFYMRREIMGLLPPHKDRNYKLKRGIVKNPFKKKIKENLRECASYGIEDK